MLQVLQTERGTGLQRKIETVEEKKERERECESDGGEKGTEKYRNS